MKSSLPASLTVLLAALAAAQDKPAAPPTEKPAPPATLQAAWQEALTLARTHKAPVLAFVLPPADERADAERCEATRAKERERGAFHRGEQPGALTARDVLLRQTQLLRLPGVAKSLPPRLEATKTQAVLALTVPVFASAADCGAKKGETVVLLAPDGKRVAGFTLDLLDAEAFARELGQHVLTASAIAPRAANVAPAAQKDLEALRTYLATGTYEQEVAVEHERRKARLAASLPAVAPALVQHQGEHVVLAPELAVLEAERAPLGSTAVHVDPCPPCGMGMMPSALSTALKLIGP